MNAGTGQSPRRIPDRSGFTLIELLLVIALIGLASTLVVINADTIFQTADDMSDNDVLALAVKEARYQAALDKQTVTLSYNPEQARFEIADAYGEIRAMIETDHDPENSPLEVQFFAILPERGLPLQRYRPAGDELDLAEVPHVRFSAARVSTPFVVEFRYGNISELYRFDPFSNLQFRTDS